MAACANAIKYALAYKDFDLNANYPPIIDNSYKFVLYPSYWKYKVDGYRFQDQIKHRDYSNNVSINDFEYFKQLLESSVCAICGDKFTVNNKPTLDRINNALPHTKDNHEGFNPFVKEFIGKRIQAKIEGNKGLEQFCKITMNSSYGSDGMNTEKYTDIKILDKKGALKSHLSNTFMDEQQLSDNAYAVQMNPETCTCKTPIQEAYFVLDNAKYHYVNFIYNFMHKAFDVTKLHFVEGDTDSAYWAVSGDASAGYQQQFNYVIKDKQFYDDNAKYYFPTIEGDLLDEKKILGLAIENEGTEMIALAPKNYYIKVGEKEKIKLKGVNQKTTKISKQNIVDNINSGTITKATNIRLGQKNYIMSKIATEKNGITGIHTKMVVLKDQSCCPYILGLKASDYIIDG
ncbi:MAG: hypothetical protein EZS28_027492 [Streblomastix strix]|uniref:DNA-directed DNA polymerase n=1 Tax=Streblomastix strix TaxID=222440 RepID=A0A5J4V4D2_9EUKA|nr:MAG: hypothetical protein EZS28_027492 [Streblomastix strix]